MWCYIMLLSCDIGIEMLSKIRPIIFFMFIHMSVRLSRTGEVIFIKFDTGELY
jgi:hypothetical protein